jgi:hypothetical protein
MEHERKEKNKKWEVYLVRNIRRERCKGRKNKGSKEKPNLQIEFGR